MMTIRQRCIEACMIVLMTVLGVIAFLVVAFKVLAWIVQRYGLSILISDYAFAAYAGILILLVSLALYVDTLEEDTSDDEMSMRQQWLTIAGLFVFIVVVGGQDIINVSGFIIDQFGDSPPPPPTPEVYDFSDFEWPFK